MFKKGLLHITLFVAVTFSTVHAQPDSVTLKLAMSKLNESLLKKDTNTLKTLIANSLSFGHSNGWIQNSRSVISDLYSGKLTYTVINQEAPNIVFENNTASVRANTAVEGLIDGNPFAMKLHILQVWMDNGKQGWKLIARQSVKIL